MNLPDKLLIKLLKWRIRKGWGADCKILDYLDLKDTPHELNAKGRCGSCQAAECVEWLERWENL